jgi:hypothetical protein
MGQVRKVQVHRLILPESVDEQMVAMLARQQVEFNSYARESVLANDATDAKGTSEESMAKVIVMEERRRLGLSDSESEINIGGQEEEN